MRRKSYYATKLKQATHLLFFKRHRKPGVKGWELKKRLGTDYSRILAMLNNYLEKLDLQVKTIFEEGTPPEKSTPAQKDGARYYVTLRGDLTPKETKMMGWRIDDIAGLALTIAMIMTKKGKASRKEIVQLLKDKLPNWRVDTNIDRYIKSGYLDQDEHGQLYLDWRTRAEVDEKDLIDSLLAVE